MFPIKLSMLAVPATLAALMLNPSVATAQVAPSGEPVVTNFPVTGFVSRVCALGAITGGDGTYALGSLIDPGTGLLSGTLTAPAKTLTGSFCNAPSTVAVSATPLTATGFVAPAPAGFSGIVDYTATASGWTTTAASFTSGAAANPGQTQNASAANASTISVSIGTFATRGGAGLRPLASTAYAGQVTLTLAVVP